MAQLELRLGAVDYREAIGYEVVARTQGRADSTLKEVRGDGLLQMD